MRISDWSSDVCSSDLLTGRLLNGDKSYDFTIGFGAETDTLDAEGRIVPTSDVRPTLADVEAVLPRFTGPIAQMPPAFSALTGAGPRASDPARAGGAGALEGGPVSDHDLAHAFGGTGR